jgi:arylsulfatase A-like enzyme/Flp pilus assembly protein TadD
MACRRLLILLAFVAATAAAFGQHPDVYLVTIDTLRADHVGAYGYARAQTPTLDALAQEGIRFEQAFTPSPITNTSHASIMTGLLPSHHGVTDFAIPLGRDKITLAAQLHAAGYHTGAFIGAIILDSTSLAPGLDQGFDFYFNFPPSAAHIKSRYGRVERRGMDVVARAQQWVAATKGPRFAWVHLYDPHDPYDPPAPYAAKFKDHPYDGEVAYADHVLGQFVAFLKQRGLYDNALIIVVGDHGEGLGEHGEDTHGIFLYDSTLHVPLIVKPPKAKPAANQRGHDPWFTHYTTAQVRTIDIAPTVLALVGVPATAKFDGESLESSLGGPHRPDRTVLAETDYPLRFGWAPLRSVRAEHQKYIDAPRPEFYDLDADPKETQNIYEPWSRGTQALRQILADAHLRKVDTSAAVPAATAAELKALGYFPEVHGETTASEPSLLPDPKDKIGEQNLLHRAMLADEDGDRPAARAALEKALVADPKSPSALLQLGQLELQDKHYQEAAALLARARDVRPTDAAVALYLGQALFRLGDYAHARVALEAALVLVPGQYEARLLLGATFAQLQQFPAAQDQLEAAAILGPRRAEPRQQLGALLVQQKKYDDAVAALTLATQLAPRDAAAYDLLAQAYRGLGKVTDARKAAAKAQQLRGRK